MFEGIGGQVRLRRSVEFFVGHALNAGRVAQPLLILVEAAAFVFLAATARTGFVAAGPGNGAAHRRGIGDNALSLFSKYVQHGLVWDIGQLLLECAYRGVRLLPLCLRGEVAIRFPDEVSETLISRHRCDENQPIGDRMVLVRLPGHLSREFEEPGRENGAAV